MDGVIEEHEAISTLMTRLVCALHRRLSQDLGHYGLTFPQFVALTALERSDGTSRMGPLAAAALQSAASMTGIVDRLIERGLVERERHTQDRRAVVVHLSEKGRALLAEVKEHNKGQLRLLLAALPADQRAHLRWLLARAVDLIEKDTAD